MSRPSSRADGEQKDATEQQLPPPRIDRDDELEQLRAMVATLMQREEQRERIERNARRQTLITRSRDELLRSSSTEQTPPPVPHVRGRLTRSPFHTPLSSRHPLLTSAVKVNDNEEEEEDEDKEDEEGVEEREKREKFNEESSAVAAHQKRLNQLYKKLDAPPTFSGDESKDKITDVREWVDVTDDYLRLHLQPSDLKKSGIIPFVLARTRGAAHDWLKIKMEETRALRQRGELDGDVHWDELKNAFIEAFEGHEFRVLRKLELESLRLGQGDCKTIVLLNARFNQLARRLYPSGTELAALDAVLADEYGKIIERSDLNLWRDVHKMGIPVTLMEWKELTAQAWGSREIIRRKTEMFHKQMSSKPYGGISAKGYVRTLPSSAQVAVNEVDHQSPERETGEWERMEGEPLSSSASVQAIHSNPRQGGGVWQGAGGTRQGPQHDRTLRTLQQRQQLMREGKCFWCCQAGHTVTNCTVKQNGGKPASFPITQASQGSGQGKV